MTQNDRFQEDFGPIEEDAKQFDEDRSGCKEDRPHETRNLPCFACKMRLFRPQIIESRVNIYNFRGSTHFVR